jgi:hypothetical protein
LRRFVRAYQQTPPLTIGELWAVAITLRPALVENLRRLAARIVTAREVAQVQGREPAAEILHGLSCFKAIFAAEPQLLPR